MSKQKAVGNAPDKEKTSSGALFATLRAAVQKKMIVNAMITRIDVFNGYELNVELNFNIRQFFEGIEEEPETESEIVTALPKTA